MQDALSPEDMAEIVVEHIVNENLSDCVEYSDKTKSFKLKISASEVPAAVAGALKNCTKATSTVFGGKLGVRVRMLPSTILSPVLIARLRSLTATVKFADAVEKMLENREAAQKVFAREFYKQVAR